MQSISNNLAARTGLETPVVALREPLCNYLSCLSIELYESRIGCAHTDPLIVDFLSNLLEPFPDPNGISAQIQDAVNPNQLLVAVKAIKNRERKSLRQSSVKTEN
jgi:hypothetical protein